MIAPLSIGFKMELSCPVSMGEVLDKISILRIKLARIKDSEKLVHIQYELDRLNSLVKDTAGCEPLIAELIVHNTVIWDVEEALRVNEKNQTFDSEFIELARSAYRTNDKRFAVKDAVNRHFNSVIREQKSHD